MTDRVRGFRVSPFGVPVAVVTDSAEVEEALHRYVLPWLPRAEIGGEGTDRVVEVRRAGSGAGLEILVDGALAGTASSPRAAIPRVERALDEAVVRGQSDIAVVHGGVVAHDGHAILLPGATGAGKSTLVAELVRRGAPYLSDEYAFIDADGRVHPYPRPLLMRDGSGEDQPRLATELAGTVAREPLVVGLILGVQYRVGSALAVEAVSQAEGALLLLRNTPQVLSEQPWILAPLQRAVGGAACYAGVRGEVAAAAAEILRLAAAVCPARPTSRPPGGPPPAPRRSTPVGSTGDP